MKIIFSFLFAFILSPAVFAQPSASQAAAERYAREIIGFSNSGDRAAYRKFVEANFSGGMLDRPMRQHLGFMSSMHDQSRGWEYVKVQDWNANEVLVLVRSKLTGSTDTLLVRVEADAPYKISGIGLRPPKADPNAARPPKVSHDQAAKQLESFVKKLADADVFSGSVLLAKDGKVLYKGAFGAANKDFNVPNRVDTKFNLGSMNKMFTGVAIAQLVEKGKVSYDDPLSKFIPDFPNAEAAQKIKIKHLLTHTAGLGGYFSDRFDELSRAKIRTVDDMMKLARGDEKDIAFEPGSRWRYSNTGMMVLGKVIEIASGQSYFDYIRENIYKPSGMTNSDCYELDRVNTNLTVGYEKEFTDAGITWSNNIFEHVMRGGPQGGGYSTAEDLLKFDQALRSGKLVSAESLKTLTTPKPELNSPNYGYGFFASAETEITGHSGGFTGINSDLRMYMRSGWTLVVMSNYGRGAGPVSNKMTELVASVRK